VAGELGNPAQLIRQGQFDVGFQWNSMFKQGFEDYDLKRSYSDGYKDRSRKGADFENDQYYMATVTYGILDRINVFARLGMVDGGKWLDYEAGNSWKGNLDSNFVWAIGAKGKVYEFDNGLGFGLAAQYMRYDDRKVKNWRSLDTGETAGDLGWATDDRIDYWQLDVMANAYWTIGAFTPYVGAGYTYYDASFSGKWTHASSYYGWIDYDASFSNENNFTALIGLDVDLGMNFKANIQGTFVSSTALTIGVSYCF
jgi:outer membrane protein W